MFYFIGTLKNDFFTSGIEIMLLETYHASLVLHPSLIITFLKRKNGHFLYDIFYYFQLH